MTDPQRTRHFGPVEPLGVPGAPRGPKGLRPATIPKPPRHLSQLAPATRQWLLVCHGQVIETKDDAIPPSTLDILLERGLIAKATTKGAREVWRPTETGRALIQAEEVRYLAQRSGDDGGGYTSNPALALRSESEDGRLLEAVSDHDLNEMTRRSHEHRADEERDEILALRRARAHELERLMNLDKYPASDAIRNARQQLATYDRMLKTL